MSQFTSSDIIYRDALKNRYAVGAFLVTSVEIMQGLINASRKEKVPFVVSISEIFFSEIGDLEAFILYLKYSIRDLNVPVALHLDHGIEPTNFEDILKLLSFGFTSVMFDGSDLPLDKNIEETKKAVEIFHAAGVTVEGALGKVPYGEIGELKSKSTIDHSLKEKIDLQQFYTDPKQAEQFVKHTGVDALAISVGTVHGLHKEDINLEIEPERIEEIRKRTNAFLVTHGGSGTSPQDIKRMISAGIVKINIASDIYSAISRNYQEKLSTSEQKLVYKFGTIKVVEETIRRYMRIFSNGTVRQNSHRNRCWQRHWTCNCS